MSTSKQTQQQQPREAADTDNPYEWSYIRVAEGVTTNVVSAVLIGIGTILLGAMYAAWVLVLSALHTPDGLVGIVALLLLGAVLMLVILAIVIYAWFRGQSSATLLSMMLGAMIGAAIGAAIDSGKLSDWIKAAAKAQEQRDAAKTESK